MQLRPCTVGEVKPQLTLSANETTPSTLLYTTADNVWRNNTAQAWGTHTAGDLVARGNVRRSLANTSNLIADASQASIAELKAQWWQNEIPNYLQWSVDIGGIETTYTNSTTANILLRTTGVKNAGIAYASTVGTAIKSYETTTATARELYLSTLMTISETAAEATMRADRDKEIALADADLQKQLTGNESAHTTAVNNANSAHSTATATAEAARKSAKQAALTQLNSTVAQAAKDKEASIAGAERTYDQTVASLDAQYGSASSNGDTGVEGATRRSAIKTRDAQYYAARDTSWANTLSGSTTLGTSPWTVKAISAANGQAAYSTSRANAQAAHDAAMLDAIEDWQLSSRESLTDLLFTEGQSRETYNVATSNVYANWGNGVGNLLGDKPEGTGWGMPVGKFAGSGNEGNNQKTGNREFAQYMVGDETGQPEGTANGDSESPTPQLPNRDNIVPRLEFDFFWIGGYRPTRESIKRQDTWIREGIPDSEEAQRSLVAYAFFTNLIGLSDYRQMCLCQAAVQDHLGRSREILHDEGVESLLEEQKRAAAGIVDNSMFKQFYEIEYIQSQLPNTTLFAVPNVDSIRDQFNLEISSRRGTTGYSNGADAAPFVDTVIIEVATLPLGFVPFGKVMPVSAARGPILSGFDMPVRPQTRSADFINPKQLLDNANDVPLQKVVNDAPVNALKVLQRTCFVGRTPILTPDGHKRIEDFKVGDAILSRPEERPEDATRTSFVEEVFRLSAPILEVCVSGHPIETTAEHPFFVVGSGWTAAKDLKEGDVLLGHDTKTSVVESTYDTGRTEEVYNLRVAVDHTYFVGHSDWGFSVWVHNTYSARQAANGTWEVIDSSGAVVRSGISETTAKGLAGLFNNVPQINKVVNSKLPHAAEQSVAKLGMNKADAVKDLKSLGESIEKGGLPIGTVPDPGNVLPRTDSLLVPFHNGAAVYEIGKNGTAKLRTLLSQQEFVNALTKLGL